MQETGGGPCPKITFFQILKNVLKLLTSEGQLNWKIFLRMELQMKYIHIG